MEFKKETPEEQIAGLYDVIQQQGETNEKLTNMISHLRHKLLKKAYSEQTGTSLLASFKLCKASEVIRTSQNLLKITHDIGFNMKLTSAAREVQLAIQSFEDEGNDTKKTFDDDFILPAKKENKQAPPKDKEMIRFVKGSSLAVVFSSVADMSGAMPKRPHLKTKK